MNWRQLLSSRRPQRQPSRADGFRLLKEKGVPIASVIDVGVLDGTSDLMAGFPDIPHLLIEPVAELAPQIRARYKAAGIEHELVTAAASDMPGELTLHLKQGADEEITHARLEAAANETARRDVRAVPALPLDDILKGHKLPSPTLLKIDVDGAELSVLKGASATLGTCSIVCIETGVANLFERSAPLLEAGFQLFDIVDLCYYDGRLAQADLIFIRRQLIAELGIELFAKGFDPARWQG